MLIFALKCDQTYQVLAKSMCKILQNRRHDSNFYHLTGFQNSSGLTGGSKPTRIADASELLLPEEPKCYRYWSAAARLSSILRPIFPLCHPAAGAGAGQPSDLSPWRAILIFMKGIWENVLRRKELKCYIFFKLIQAKIVCNNNNEKGCC